MPVPKIDSSLQEYSFTQAEEINVKILSPLMIAWLQNKYANIFKQKAVTIVPNSSELDRDYLLMLGELEGKLSLIQELFIEHEEALDRLKDPEFKQAVEQTGTNVVNDLATRAANQVNQS